MRPSSLTAFTIIIMVFLTACGGEPEEQTETTTEPSTETEQTTAATDSQAAADGEQKPPEAPTSEEFNDPMEPGNDPTSIGNLLTATNPEQRQEQVKQEIRQDRNSRDNPFGAPTVGTDAPQATPLNVDNLDTVEQATQNLKPQQVPDLPELPVLALAPPPASPPQRPGGQQPSQRPGGQQPPQRPGGQQPPQRPGGQQPPQRPGGQQSNNVPGTQQRQQQGQGGRPSVGGGTGSSTRDPRNGQKPSIPSLQARGVPDLPGLPEKIGPEKLPLSANGQPIAQIPTTAQTPRGVPDLPELPTPIGPEQLPPSANGQPVAQIPTTAQTPRGVPDLPELPTPIGPEQLPPEPEPVPQQDLTPPPPPLPDTQLADGIEVTGVIEVGSQIQIIAKAPNEATSRYIKVGQKIANGQVIVKRVDKEGGEPVVIFEQNGVEVRKIVGEKVEIATDQPI
jgi:hypothetical protein